MTRGTTPTGVRLAWLYVGTVGMSDEPGRASKVILAL